MKSNSRKRFLTVLVTMVLLASMATAVAAATTSQSGLPLQSTTSEGVVTILVEGVDPTQLSNDVLVYARLNEDKTGVDESSLLGPVNTFGSAWHVAGSHPRGLYADSDVFLTKEDLFVKIYTYDGTFVGWANARFLRPVLVGQQESSGKIQAPAGEGSTGPVDPVDPVEVDPILILRDFGSNNIPADAISSTNFGAVWFEVDKDLDLGIQPNGDIKYVIRFSYEYQIGDGPILTSESRSTLWPGVLNDNTDPANPLKYPDHGAGYEGDILEAGVLYGTSDKPNATNRQSEMFNAIVGGAEVTFRVVITLEKDAHYDAGAGYTPGHPIQEIKTPPVKYTDGGTSNTNGESGHQDRIDETEETFFDEDGNPIPAPASVKPLAMEGEVLPVEDSLPADDPAPADAPVPAPVAAPEPAGDPAPAPVPADDPAPAPDPASVS